MTNKELSLSMGETVVVAVLVSTVPLRVTYSKNSFNCCSKGFVLDNTQAHIYIYIQSNKITQSVLMSKFIQQLCSTCFGPHRTTRHAQPLHL